MRGITAVILKAMKTAISIPDEVFEAADRTAKKLGLSRSELYATAVREYVKRCQTENITSRLNEVYSSNDSHLDHSIQNAQTKVVAKEDW